MTKTTDTVRKKFKQAIGLTGFSRKMDKGEATLHVVAFNRVGCFSIVYTQAEKEGLEKKKNIFSSLLQPEL